MRRFTENNWRVQLRGACSFLYLGIGTLCFAGITPEASPNFKLETNVKSVTVTAAGEAGWVTVSATSLNGFKGTIAVTLSGLPKNVAASPDSFILKSGTPQKVSLTANLIAVQGDAALEFKGTSGNLSHAASVGLGVDVVEPDAVTYHYDIGRTGWNPHETVLTHANVNPAAFGLLRILPVDGLVDGQPLYLSKLTAGGKVRSVVYAVTENDSVFAFDADTGAQIWKHSVLGAREKPSGDHNCSQITPQIGITSTPVIDRNSGPHGTIFVVGMTMDDTGRDHQRLHALDLTTGAELHPPTEIRASYPGNGANSSNGRVIFDPGQYAERAGLLLMNGTIYLAWTSHCDDDPYTGWLMGYSESTLQQTSVLDVTPNGSEGSIWMAGSGIAASALGSIFLLDANGTFDTTLNAKGFPVNSDYGNGFLKISTANHELSVADYFEDLNTVSESDGDADLGSGGALVIPDLKDESGRIHQLAVGAGKTGNMYVVNRDNMGKFNPNNDNIYEEIDGQINSVYSMPAYYNSAIYYAAVSDTLKAFPIRNARVASSPALQSANSFPYPGATPSVSSNGITNGIVWAVENNSPAVLHAYEASNLAEIYNTSQAANGRDNFGNGNKFITPMVIDGKVLVGTPSGVAVFGLLK